MPARLAPLLTLLLAAGCPDDGVDGGAVPERWEVLVSADAPEAVRVTAEDVASYLERMGRNVQRIDASGETSCAEGVGRVTLLGDGLGEARFDSPAPTDQTWRVEEQRCGDGLIVTLEGGGLLGRQYAAYEWLHQVGVRFFHPEEEWVPDEPDLGEAPLVREHTPSFPVRSVGLHLTHPLELGDAFRLGDEAALEEARRYIDWQIKNGATNGQRGIGEGEYARWGAMRGFPREGGINLHNAQQGGRPVIDPDDPRSEEAQITEAIEAVMDVEEPPSLFSFSFNPSEFTEIPDTDALRQITFIADYMAENYPDVELFTTNHGTAGAPTETYGIRFYDLPQLAPENLGVKVHTLMFYDLERPAPVYGNDDFQYFFDFMEREYRHRKLWYFPEAAWWLTFDIAVPLYLPITIEARDRDIQRIAFMLEGGLEGHRVFGTGHEWGYWQNEYCSFRMAADLAYRWTDCVRDMAYPTGEAAPEVAAVLEEAVALQEGHMFDAELLRYLVGTDDETEVAASVGIVFHPLPPAPPEILRWDDGQVTAWQDGVGPELDRIARAYAGLAARLDAVEAQVPERARNFFGEVRDGLEVNGIRARHAEQLYGALVDLRDAQLNLASTEAAETKLAAAMATTGRAIEVIRRREMGYRYTPIDRSIAGGPDGDEDVNWTVYGYRYLNRTHHAFYYTRADQLAMDAFAGAAEAIAVEDALLAPGESLLLDVLDPELAEVTVAFGDGAEEMGGPRFTHDYAGPEVYGLTVSGTRAGEPFSWGASVAELLIEYQTTFDGTVVEPPGAEIIEPVMPALVFGPIDASRSAVGFATDDSGHVAPSLWTEAVPVASGALFEAAVPSATVPIINRGTGVVQTSITVLGATIRLTDASSPLVLSGELPTDDVVDAVVAIGGFDRPGARMVVAAALGYTPEELPERVPLTVEYPLR